MVCLIAFGVADTLLDAVMVVVAACVAVWVVVVVTIVGCNVEINCNLIFQVFWMSSSMSLFTGSGVILYWLIQSSSSPAIGAFVHFEVPSLCQFPW